MSDLPATWATVEVRDIFDKIVDGSHNPPAGVADGLPMLSARNILNDGLDLTEIRRLTAEDFQREDSRTRTREGDVLLTIVGSIGRSHTVSAADGPLTFQRSVAVLHPVEVSAKYCCYQFQSPQFQRQLEDSARGTAQKGVYLKVLSALRLNIAPRSEQDRIVAEIEKQFTRLDAATAALKRVQANLKRYRASVLKAACEGRLVPTEAKLARKEGRDYEPADQLLQRILRERRARWEADTLAKMIASGKPPKDDRWKQKYKEPAPPDANNLPDLPEGWCWASVDQLASGEFNSLTDGPFGSNLKTTHYTSAGPRVIRLQNIGDGVFRDADAHISEGHYSQLTKHCIFAGDLVIASLGNPAPRACAIPDIGPAIVKADCIRFKPAILVASKFLVAGLNSEGVRKRTSDRIHGIGRPRLNLEEIRSISLPLPPRFEQERIALSVDEITIVIDRQLDVIDHAFAVAAGLRRSILASAFRGELVPHNPTDEPASDLLERIRAKRQRENPRGRTTRVNGTAVLVNV